MNQNDAGESSLRLMVGLIDADGWRLARCADEELALTLFAVASEDPADWQEINAIDDPRDTPIRRPRPNRAVLFEQPMIDELARRILQVSRSGRWRNSGAAADPKKRYSFTVEVHRDWLMTPRADLDGKTPREMLHGAMGWMDHLVWAQRLRFEDCRLMIAAPTDVSEFDVAPMGREEVSRIRH